MDRMSIESVFLMTEESSSVKQFESRSKSLILWQVMKGTVAKNKVRIQIARIPAVAIGLNASLTLKSSFYIFLDFLVIPPCISNTESLLYCHLSGEKES